MAQVTVPAIILKNVADWNIPDQDIQSDLVISWDYQGKMKVGIVRGNEVDDVTGDYDIDFDQWNKDLDALKETNELENEDYSV